MKLTLLQIRKLYYLFCLVFHGLTATTVAQQKETNFYSGGMLLLQPGMVKTNNTHQKIEEFTLGVGGILRLYMPKPLMIGIYGGTQKATYKTSHSDNSQIQCSFGGPLVGWSKKIKRFRYSGALYMGMGSIKNLHIENQINHTLKDAYLYNESVIVGGPIISVDYALSSKLMLTAQTTGLLTKFIQNNNYQQVALQIGLLFNR